MRLRGRLAASGKGEAGSSGDGCVERCRCLVAVYCYRRGQTTGNGLCVASGARSSRELPSLLAAVLVGVVIVGRSHRLSRRPTARPNERVSERNGMPGR